MKKLIVVGFGGFGREVSWLGKDCGFDVLGFLDDSSPIGNLGRYTVLGKVNDWVKFRDCFFVVAVGNPRTRKKIVENMASLGEVPWATLVHPSVPYDKESVLIGKGSMICAGVVMTVDATIGQHVIVNIKSTVAHDDQIGDFVTVAPLVAISGNVELGAGAEVGTGACIRQGISMGEGAMLGMGGVLTKDVPANEIYLGSPARPFKALAPF